MSFPDSFLHDERSMMHPVSGSIDVPIRLACHTQTECEIAPCMHAATMDSAFIHSSACPPLLYVLPLPRPYTPPRPPLAPPRPYTRTGIHSCIGIPTMTKVIPKHTGSYTYVYMCRYVYIITAHVHIRRRRHTHTHLVHWYRSGEPLSRPRGLVIRTKDRGGLEETCGKIVSAVRLGYQDIIPDIW